MVWKGYFLDDDEYGDDVGMGIRCWVCILFKVRISVVDMEAWPEEVGKRSFYSYVLSFNWV